MGEMHTTLELRKGLAERLFTLAEREGMSVEELLSRAIELSVTMPRLLLQPSKAARRSSQEKRKLLQKQCGYPVQRLCSLKNSKCFGTGSSLESMTFFR